MKFSKYLFFASIFAAGTLTLTSCGDDNNTPDPTPGGSTPSENALHLSTTVLTQASPVLDLSEGATMNVFVKTGQALDSKDYVTGVKASFDGGQWKLSPAVEFSSTQRTLFVYAVYPFEASGSFDPVRYPVDCSKQIDVLYSGGAAAANIDQGITTAKLTMKHALAMASFNISSSNYTGQGKLTSLAINGTGIFTEGNLNISTGEIIGTGKKAFTVDVDKNVTATGWHDGIPSIWMLPTTTKGNPATLTAVIDGKTYNVDVPEVEIRGGFQTIFRLILTPNGLVFRPDQTETISLNVGTDDPTLAVGYGTLTFTTTAGKFQFPAFTGDNVFGNVVSGDTQLNYSIGGAITLTAGVASVVTIESWNSTGFSLGTIEGLDEIDLSNY